MHAMFTRPALLLAATCLAAGATAPRTNDAAIVEAAQKSYNFRVYLKGDAIQVASSGGDVTLTGTAANEFHKALAEQTVLGIKGVKSVDNRLSTQTDSATAPADAWLATKVRTALRYHRNVDESTIQVEAQDGVVTLRGQAGSAAHRTLAWDIAKEVDGVRDVKNEIAVVTNPPSKTLAETIDDASITAQVKAVLLAHRGTHMLATKVRTDRGLVAIGGNAENAAEKELVTRLVSDVRGVKRIDNRMKIKKP